MSFPPSAPEADVAKFVETMPYAYRLLHGEDERRLHAGIAERRGRRAVHVERFDGPGISGSQDWLAVVTDDRPGLLSLISSVVLAHSLDIVSAKAYCRIRSGHPAEAVDFLLVRPLRAPYEGLDVNPESIATSLDGLLFGETNLDDLARQAAPTSPPKSDRPAVVTRVYFAPGEDDLLVVESKDRRGLLLAMTLAMLRERVTIERSDVSTIDGMARDEFSIAEFDGSALSAERKSSIVRRLTELLDSM